MALTKTLLAVTAALLTAPALLPAAPLALGAKAPSPTACDQDGNPIDWPALHAKGWVLVFFYPKADTPGCTKQACSLRDGFAELQQKGVTVIGVSGDNATSQKAFRVKHRLPFPLIADPDGKVMDAFGVPHLGRLAKRQAYLFKNGVLVWRDLAAATDAQAADVLAAIAAHH